MAPAQTCGAHGVFQHNYALCSAFLDKVASLAISRSAFWDHPKTQAFLGKWELPVYITSLSLDLMTSQISQLLRKTGGDDKETTGGCSSRL
mgnify:CR=1 FL=1